MARATNEDWDRAINTTYEICQDQGGRGYAFVDTLAKALNVEGRYQELIFLYYFKKFLLIFVVIQ